MSAAEGGCAPDQGGRVRKAIGVPRSARDCGSFAAFPPDVYHSTAMKPYMVVAVLAATSFAQTRPSTPAAAGDETLQLLRALADAPGPSGFEEPVRKIMVDRMKPLSDKPSYDGMGSLIAVQGTSGPRIMVDAHMDELGGVIRRVTSDGYLTMQMLGGWL